MGAHTGWRCVRLTSWRRWSTVINSGSAPSNVCSKYAEHRRWQLSTITLHSPSNQRHTVSDSVVGLQPASVWIVAERCVAFTEYWLSLSSVTITPSMHMHPDTNVCLPKCLCRSVLLMCSSVLRTELIIIIYPVKTEYYFSCPVIPEDLFPTSTRHYLSGDYLLLTKNAFMNCEETHTFDILVHTD